MRTRDFQADLPSASKLNFTLTPKTYAQLKADLTKQNGGATGKELSRKIIQAAKQQTQELGCFVAGTLVHTKDGLKSIEQIKVGDLVLSRHESGEGELCYQPVTRTFQYEDREVYFVSWQVLEPGTNKPTKVYGHMVVTGAHPIWVQRLVDYPLSDEGVSEQVVEMNQWLSAEDIYLRRWKNYWEQLGGGASPYVELADGRMAVITFIKPILQSENHDIGVGFDDDETWQEDPFGTEIRFEQDGPQISYGDSGLLPEKKYLGNIDRDAYDYTGYDTESSMSVVKRSYGFLPMRRRVYNLEVADTHTYFVTEQGLWVHNTSSVLP